MAYVRVSAQVLLWTDPTDPVKARQENFQFLVPCAEDLTIEEFEKEVKNRFAGIRAWKGLGPLKINYLTDNWDNVLDRDLIVGHVFKDDKGVEDRICKVVQLPLTPEELRNLQRYGSVVPEATARPRKHLLDPSSPGLHSNLRNAAYKSAQQSEPSERNGSHKRQKTHDSRLYDKNDFDRPIPSYEGLEEGLYISSQSSGRRSSPVNQVMDSQKPPRNKQPNPYGTPTSLTVNSPLKQATIKDYPFSIPDSPPSRAASFSNHNSYVADDLELRNTKSESPELTSVFELPLDDIAAITEREAALKIAGINGDQVTPSQIPQLNGWQAQNSESAEVSRCLTNTALPLSAEVAKTEIVHFAKPNLPSSRGPSAKANRHRFNGVRAQSLDVLDPVETEIESSQESQHTRGAKRLRHENALLKTSSPPTPSDHTEQACEHKPFVVPPLPKSHPKAAATLVSDENAKYSDSGANTHLRVEVPTLIQSGFQKDVAPNVVHHALVPQQQQQIDEPLPWEIQGEDRLVGRKAPELPKQPKGDITGGETSGEGIAFSVQKGEELRANKLKEGKALTLKELDSVKERTSKTSPADVITAQKTSSADPKVKEKLFLQRKAVEEKTSRNEPVDDKSKVKKLEEEKLAREQKLREAEALQRRAWHRELAALNNAKHAKNAGKNFNKQQAPVDFEKAQDAKEVSMSAESGTNDLPKLPEVLHKVMSGTKRKATSPSLESQPAKTLTLDERSDIRNRNSSTPSNMRSDTDRVRSSMTPAIPGGTKRSSDSGNSRVTSRLSAQTPLPSALRQNSSVPRRSVSFVEEPSDPTKLDSSPSTAAAGKLIANKSKRPQSRVTEDECKSRASSTAVSTASISSVIPKQSRELSKKPATKEKVQTKLNVKRDKKMKGREVDRPPKVLKPVLQDETVISSESEKSVSTFYSDEEDRARNAKAGPSSKKKPCPAEAEAPATTKPCTPDTPASETRQSSSQDAKTPSQKPSLGAATKAPTRAKSPSRSPAQYMSREKSVSSGPEPGSGSGSGSESESGSGSGSESGSESGSSSESEPKLPALAQVEKQQGKAKPSLLKSGGSGDVEMEDASSTQSSRSKSISQSSQSSSVASKVFKESTEDDGRRLAQDADQQLQRECRQSLDPSGVDERSKTPNPHNVKIKPSSSAKKPVDPNHPVRQRGKPSSSTKRESSKENSNTLRKPVDEPDKPSKKTLRPANQRYSSINELMKQPKAEVRSHAPTQKTADSQVATASVADYSESSSDDSEDSSTSDDNVPANGANQTRITSKNKAASGFNGVMKLARQVRARGTRQ